MMINGVIPIGFKLGPAGCIEFIATDDGARILPAPQYVDQHADSNGYRTLRWAVTRDNIMALRFCGLTAGDANRLLASIEQPPAGYPDNKTVAVVTGALLD